MFNSSILENSQDVCLAQVFEKMLKMYAQFKYFEKILKMYVYVKYLRKFTKYMFS